MRTAKTDGGQLRTINNRCNREANYDFLIQRWMTSPLDAQSIAGTFDLLFRVKASWEDAIAIDSDASQVRYKIHIYIAVGESTIVRHTLLSNYVDTVDWPEPPTAETFQGLASAQTLTTNSTVAGDVIVVEIGARILVSPTPAATYPPTNQTHFPLRGRGTTDAANVVHPDAVAGDTLATRAPWMEFSATITEQAGAPPPPNDACADATVIASLPFTSPFIDTTAATDAGFFSGGRAVWWTWTAGATGKACFAARGANYGCRVTVLTGAGCGALGTIAGNATRNALAVSRSMSSTFVDVTQGVQYWIVVENLAGVLVNHRNAVNGGGLCRLIGFFRDVPATDDLYLAIQDIEVLRETAPGVLTPVNLSSSFFSLNPTGIAIDYTKRPMVSFSPPSPNVDERLLVGLFDFDLVEVVDLKTLSWAPSVFEIDFIDPWFPGSDDFHHAQMHVTFAGFMWLGNFGNGFQLVAGVGSEPAFLDEESNDPDLSSVLGIEADHGSSQPGAPFAFRTLDSPYPTLQRTASWAISVDEVNNILFYTSGGFYSPETGDHPTRVTTVCTEIRRYDLNTNTQLGVFATVTPTVGNNPGLKGIRFIPLTGGLLACNAEQIIEFDQSGGVVRTYTPSIAADSQSLVEVVLVQDQTAFWVLDEATTRLFKFSRVTGLELATFQPYLTPGTTVQMQVYQPVELSPPGVTGPPRDDGLPYAPPDVPPCPGPGDTGAVRDDGIPYTP
jgi:hypothetical protein